MVLRLILLLVACLICIGCSRLTQTIPSELTHAYIIKVISPLTHEEVSGATVKCYSDSNETGALLLTTGENGQVKYEVSGPSIIDGRSVYYMSNVECIASNGNYFIEEKIVHFPSKKIYWRWGDSTVTTIKKVVELNDFESILCKGIYDDYPQDSIGTLAKWLSVVSLPNNLRLMELCSDSYKGKQYLKISLKSVMEYNANKLFDYDVAKVLFVKPVLEYARTAFELLDLSKRNYGLSVSIETRLRDFINEDDLGRSIVIKFFMPNDSISSFMAQNITRQELVDQSLVFINSDMVRLKFQ